jgi:DNA polymerase III alpha subunit
VACPAIHYALPGDRLKYDIVQSIRTLTLLRQEHPEKRLDGRLHFRTPAEMAAACKGHPEWLAHSPKLPDRCNFELPFGKPQFPAFVPPDGSRHTSFCTGWSRMDCNGVTANGPAMRPQIEQELNIISAVGYEEYFLVVWNILQDCRAHGIEWITRGSAADSLVCYCLGISDVCPIRFGLYFRRFLNEERMALNKLPDIDIDFPHDRKDDVVEYHLRQIRPRALRRGRRLLDVPGTQRLCGRGQGAGRGEREVSRFTDHFPWSFGGGWVPDEHTRAAGPSCATCSRPARKTATCR